MQDYDPAMFNYTRSLTCSCTTFSTETGASYESLKITEPSEGLHGATTSSHEFDEIDEDLSPQHNHIATTYPHYSNGFAGPKYVQSGHPLRSLLELLS